jgi:ribose transport system substrate-binding protein
MSTLANPFFGAVKDAAVAEAKKDGYKVIVADAQNNNQKQLSDVQDMITKGVSAVLLNPIEPKSSTPIVKQANARNIPVITLDRSSQGGNVASFIASDNVKGGNLICTWLGEHEPNGASIAILQGIIGTSPEIDRNKGCTAALQKFPKIKVVAEQPANWDQQQGYTVTQNIMQAHPDLNAIFGRNDLASLGAIQALQQSGKLDQVKIVSFDGISDALQSIKAGKLSATVVQDPELMGQRAVQTAKKLFDGKKVPAEQALPVRVADASNIDDFLK